MKKYIFLIFVALLFNGCLGEIVGEVLKNALQWEERPLGISCTDTFVEAENSYTVPYTANDLVCVHIAMDPDDFNFLRFDSKFGISTEDKDALFDDMDDYLVECDLAWPSEYTWFKANISVDGRRLNEVGIRKKGLLGSIFSIAPSIKIKTDKFVEDQELGDTEKITLNNNSEDQSRILTVIAAKVFELAGYPAPRANMANVTVNGEALGSYTHLEPVKKKFLRNQFGNDTGDLYEGTIVDFYENSLPRWESKTNETDDTKQRIKDVAEALTANDNNLISELEQHINLDAFIRFWALEILLNHKDGYSSNKNNFFIYFDPNDANKGHFIPWGIGSSDMLGNTRSKTFTSSEIVRRLSRNATFNQKLENELSRLINEVWDEDFLLNYATKMSTHVIASQESDTYVSELESVTNWISNRKGDIQELLSSGLKEGNKNPDGCK